MIRTEPTLSTSAPAVCRRPIELCPSGTCQPCDELGLLREGAYGWTVVVSRARVGRMRRFVTATALLLSLALSAPAWSAEASAPKAASKPRTKPAVTISVKVYADGRVPAGQAKISTADADSCVAWIGADDDALMVKALRACRAEVAKAKQ